MEKTFSNFDNPKAPWNYQDTDSAKDYLNYAYGYGTNYDQPINAIKFKTIRCDYVSLILDDDTVTDFTDCMVRADISGITILNKDNTVVYYYNRAIKGYTYRAKTYNTHTDC